MTTYQDNTAAHLQRMWDEIQQIHTAADLSTRNEEARMYKGIKVVKQGDQIKVYSSENEFYKDVTCWFTSGDEFNDSFLTCAHRYIKDRYLRRLDTIERRIKLEMNSSKNHKRFARLKTTRTNLLNKYNEINSKETTAG